MTKRLQMVCGYCGSPYVVKDAWASWAVEEQIWTIDAVYDSAYCNSCDAELKYTESVDLDALPDLAAAQAKAKAERAYADLYVLFMDKETKLD